MVTHTWHNLCLSSNTLLFTWYDAEDGNSFNACIDKQAFIHPKSSLQSMFVLSVCLSLTHSPTRPNLCIIFSQQLYCICNRYQPPVSNRRIHSNANKNQDQDDDRRDNNHTCMWMKLLQKRQPRRTIHISINPLKRKVQHVPYKTYTPESIRVTSPRICYFLYTGWWCLLLPNHNSSPVQSSLSFRPNHMKFCGTRIAVYLQE